MVLVHRIDQSLCSAGKSGRSDRITLLGWWHDPATITSQDAAAVGGRMTSIHIGWSVQNASKNFSDVCIMNIMKAAPERYKLELTCRLMFFFPSEITVGQVD